MAFWNKKKKSQSTEWVDGKPDPYSRDPGWKFHEKGRTEFHGPKGTRVGEDLDEGLNRINREQQAEAARQAKLDAKQNADRVRQYQKDQKRQKSEEAFKQRQQERYNEGQQSWYSKPGPEQSNTNPQSDYEKIKKERDDFKLKFGTAYEAGKKEGFRWSEAKAKGIPYKDNSELDEQFRWKPKTDEEWARYYAEQGKVQEDAKAKLAEDLEVKAFNARNQKELDDARKEEERQEKLSGMGWIDRRKFTHNENVKEKLSTETARLVDRYGVSKTVEEVVKVPGAHVPVLGKDGQPIFDKEGKPVLTWVGEHLERRIRERRPEEMVQAARDAKIGDINYHEMMNAHRAQKVEGWLSPLTTGGKLLAASAIAGASGAGEAMRQHRGGTLGPAVRNFAPQPGAGQNPLYQINRPAAPIIRQPTPQFNPNGQSLAHLRNIQIVRNQNLSPVPQSRTSLMQTRAPSTAQGFRGNLPNVTAKHGIMAKKMRLW